MQLMIDMKRLVILFICLTIVKGSFSQRQFRTEVHFNLDKYSLRADALATLDSLCLRLEKADSVNISLTGHTDSLGSIAYNTVLSKNRATAIKNYITDHGLFVTQSDWFGETKPEYTKGRDSLNRRVEIRIIVMDKIYPKKRKRIVDPQKLEDMEKLRVGDVFVLRNIQFVLDKTAMVGDSVMPINLLYEFMSKHPTSRVAIMGHVCCFNDYPLSFHRAEKIKQIMVDKEIDPLRIRTEGYGNTRKLVEEKTKKDQQINRRIEIKILHL